MKSFRIPRFHTKPKRTHSLTSELFIIEPVKAKGSIKASDDILIDTTFDGAIQSDGHLTLGPNAVIKGSVQARSIHHQGSLSGNMQAKNAITLQSGSKLQQGNLTSEKIEIQPGSELKDVKVTTLQG